jgi:phospholipase/lecithinase/hemolysin
MGTRTGSLVGRRWEYLLGILLLSLLQGTLVPASAVTSQCQILTISLFKDCRSNLQKPKRDNANNEACCDLARKANDALCYCDANFLASAQQQGVSVSAIQASLILFCAVRPEAINLWNVSGCVPTPKKPARKSIFAFGDSFLVMGNPNLIPPYGIDFPVPGSGRFGNGRIISDYAAYHLRAKGPPFPYSQLQPSMNAPPSGLSFAVGGSGVTNLVGNLITGNTSAGFSTQISWFEGLVRQRRIRPAKIATAVFMISTGGNDFIGALLGGLLANMTGMERAALQRRVVRRTLEGVARLEAAGARSFIFLTGMPPGCFPFISVALNYSQCLPASNIPIDLSAWRSGLRKMVNAINAGKKSRAVILELERTYETIAADLNCYGFRELFRPCCEGPPPFGCATRNLTTGQSLATVCPARGSSFWWDDIHPSDAGWRQLAALTFRGTNFTFPGPNACQALQIECDGEAPKCLDR